MELKEKILSSFLAFEQTIDIKSDIHKVRSNAIKDFEKVGLPTKKMEAWKYTSLTKVLDKEYTLLSAQNTVSNTIDYQDIEPYLIKDMDTYTIVFVDGVYHAQFSQTTHDTFDICLLSSALSNNKYKPVLDVYFNQIAPSENMVTLNTAFTSEGAYIYIPKNVAVHKPVQILHITTGKNTSQLIQPRNLIVVEDNSEISIIERHQNLSENRALSNAVTEMYVGKNSHVNYYKIQNDTEKSSLIDNTFIKQLSNSVCGVHTFSFGGEVVRNNLNFYQDGNAIDSILNGVTVIEGKTHIDHNTLVAHNTPNCESHQNYKGIFNDKSTGVFNGKIIVDKIAQKTNAFQSNNNILLSDKATVNSKPQLEIFADDVRCSHGCTIGQLDKDALFYLKSRGIPQKEASALLTYAFAGEVLEEVKLPKLKKRINTLIAQKLGVEIGFDI